MWRCTECGETASYGDDLFEPAYSEESEYHNGAVTCIACGAEESHEEIDDESEEALLLGESVEDIERRILEAQLDQAHGMLESMEPSGERERLRAAINAEAWAEIAEFVGEPQAVEQAAADFDDWRG